MAVVSWELALDGSAYRGSSSYTESTEQLVAVATGTTNGSLNFGGVTTATALFLLSDQAVSVNINSNTETAKSLVANKPMFLSGTSVTAVYITNASGSTANITFKIWGA